MLVVGRLRCQFRRGIKLLIKSQNGSQAAWQAARASSASTRLPINVQPFRPYQSAGVMLFAEHDLYKRVWIPYCWTRGEKFYFSGDIHYN